MKKFSKFITEEPVGRRDNHTFVSNPSNGYLNDEVVSKLNAIVGRIFAEGSKFDPSQPLNLCRSSLSKIGLTFDQYPAMTESNGSFSLPLTLFGGRFGKDENTPYDEFLEDDGISNQIEGGLSLNISYEMTETNQCRLRANIA